MKERKVKIAPSILSADFTCLGKELKAVEKAGADLIHIDVMDGHFVPNITYGPLIVSACKRACSLELDAHLMIENPDEYIEAFAKAGADWISVHLEASIHLNRTVQEIKKIHKKLGLKKRILAGVVLNPATPVRLLEDIIEELDYVLIMSVNPGFGAQEFIPHSLSKIRELRKMIDNKKLPCLIEVDGGVTVDNAPSLIKAGVNILVAGNTVFKSNDYKKTISLLRKERK